MADMMLGVSRCKSVQTVREVVQILRNDVVAGQNCSLIGVQQGSDPDILLRPTLIFRHRPEKSLDVLLEIIHVGQQSFGRAFA